MLCASLAIFMFCAIGNVIGFFAAVSISPVHTAYIFFSLSFMCRLYFFIRLNHYIFLGVLYFLNLLIFECVKDSKYLLKSLNTSKEIVPIRCV